MFSNDKNIERIATIVEEAQQWLLLRKEQATQEVANKTATIVSAIATILIIVGLLMLILIYLSFSVAYALEPLTGSMALSFIIVALFYVFILLIFLLLRNKVLTRPLLAVAGIDETAAIEKETFETNIKDKEKHISQLWDELFHPKEEQTSLIPSPTQRAIKIMSSSANILDGAILGWKLYKKFKKKK